MADLLGETAALGDKYLVSGTVVKKIGSDVTVALGSTSSCGGKPVTVKEDDVLNIETLASKLAENGDAIAANAAALDGDFDVGGDDITNVGLVDGVDVSAAVWRYTVNAGGGAAGATTGFVLSQAGGITTAYTGGLPIPVPQDCKLARVAVTAKTSSGTSSSWTLRIRLNGSGSDLATYTFTPGITSTPTCSSGTWATGAGSEIDAGDMIEVLVDGASLNDVYVRVEFFLRMR